MFPPALLPSWLNHHRQQSASVNQQFLRRLLFLSLACPASQVSLSYLGFLEAAVWLEAALGQCESEAGMSLVQRFLN